MDGFKNYMEVFQMSISENIKNLRLQYDLTQSELGEIAGVSDKAVSTWENGTAEPRMGAIQRIAEHFHISKGSLVDDAPDIKPTGDSLTASEAALLTIVRKLNDAGQQKVFDCAKDLQASGLYLKTAPSAVVETA